MNARHNMKPTAKQGAGPSSIARLEIPGTPTAIFIGVALLVWALSFAGIATAFDFHADSAHGNNGYGLNRKNLVLDPDHPDAYDTGECAHCHDTFNDAICGINDLMLFNTNYFCVQCHVYPTNSYQQGMPYQGCYSYTFGGASITCPASIKEAFLFVDQVGDGQPVLNCGSNKGSSHNLADIASYLQDRWDFSDTSDDFNICEGCHNPHKAQRHSYPSGSVGGSPVSRPSTHAGNWDVYGADPSERMDGYTYHYEPPYAVGGGREWPTTGGGASAPDINTVCLDCHSGWGVISTRYGELMALGSTGGRHGAYHSTTHDAYYGGLNDPYEEWDFVTMMCTDCHEPHGSPNEFLLRTCVNGKSNILITEPGNYREFCTACHWLGTYHAGSGVDECTDCHYHNVNF